MLMRMGVCPFLCVGTKSSRSVFINQKKYSGHDARCTFSDIIIIDNYCHIILVKSLLILTIRQGYTIVKPGQYQKGFVNGTSYRMRS